MLMAGVHRSSAAPASGPPRLASSAACGPSLSVPWKDAAPAWLAVTRLILPESRTKWIWCGTLTTNAAGPAHLQLLGCEWGPRHDMILQNLRQHAAVVWGQKVGWGRQAHDTRQVGKALGWGGEGRARSEDAGR
jgi:hypothetical protein